VTDAERLANIRAGMAGRTRYEGLPERYDEFLLQLIDSTREALKIARKAMTDYLAGDYVSPRNFRPDKCEHGIFYFETCENCIDQHFVRALARIAELVPEMGE